MCPVAVAYQLNQSLTNKLQVTEREPTNAVITPSILRHQLTGIADDIDSHSTSDSEVNEDVNEDEVDNSLFTTLNSSSNAALPVLTHNDNKQIIDSAAELAERVAMTASNENGEINKTAIEEAQENVEKDNSTQSDINTLTQYDCNLSARNYLINSSRMDNNIPGCKVQMVRLHYTNRSATFATLVSSTKSLTNGANLNSDNILIPSGESPTTFTDDDFINNRNDFSIKQQTSSKDANAQIAPSSIDITKQMTYQATNTSSPLKYVAATAAETDRQKSNVGQITGLVLPRSIVNEKTPRSQTSLIVSGKPSPRVYSADDMVNQTARLSVNNKLANVTNAWKDENKSAHIGNKKGFVLTSNPVVKETTKLSDILVTSNQVIQHNSAKETAVASNISNAIASVKRSSTMLNFTSRDSYFQQQFMNEDIPQGSTTISNGDKTVPSVNSMNMLLRNVTKNNNSSSNTMNTLDAIIRATSFHHKRNSAGAGQPTARDGHRKDLSQRVTQQQVSLPQLQHHYNYDKSSENDCVDDDCELSPEKRKVDDISAILTTTKLGGKANGDCIADDAARSRPVSRLSSAAYYKPHVQLAHLLPTVDRHVADKQVKLEHLHRPQPSKVSRETSQLWGFTNSLRVKPLASPTILQHGNVDT